MTSASLVSLAVHAALLAGASFWMWGTAAPAEEELVFEVSWAPERRRETAPEPVPEPPRVVRARDEVPEPELVITSLPEPVPVEIVEPEPAEPRERSAAPDASTEIAAAMNSDWTPRPGSRANSGIGVGAGGSAGATPRAVSGFGQGPLEGTGSSPIPTDAPPVAATSQGVPPRAPVLVAAQLIENPRPPYPRASLRLGEQGSVLLRLHVSAEGVVGEVEIVESSGSERLDAAAVAGVKTWTFRPATRDGAPIASLELHRVTFKLNESPR